MCAPLWGGKQSNDFALGLPILSALYPQFLIDYLYLFAPINFLLVYQENGGPDGTQHAIG